MLINKLLLEVDVDDLERAIGSERLDKIRGLLNSEHAYTHEDYHVNIVNCLIALHGSNLLSEQKIRKLVFYTINESKLEYLVKKYCKKHYKKGYDNALELSILPWKFGSEFVLEISDILSLPLEYLPLEKTTLQNTIIIKPPGKFYPLHDYQEEVKDKILHELVCASNRFLVQMPTGAGKTRTVQQSIIEYIHDSKLLIEGRIILWLAHTEELCEQAIDTFSNLWFNLSDYPISIHRFYGDYSSPPLEDTCCLIVGTLQKFASLLKSNSYQIKKIKSSLKIIVVDEAHKTLARTYSKVIDYLTESHDVSFIGITATPGRNTKNITENTGLAEFFNKRLIAPNFIDNPIVELRDKGILSFLKRRVIETNIDVVLSKKESNFIVDYSDFPDITLKNLENNVKRNKLIIQTIEQEIHNNNSCLVFACSVDHAHILNAALNFNNYQSLTLDFSTSRSRRKIIIDAFKNGECNVLLNFGILSTGFDAPNIRTIIITRPTTSIILYSQMIGRGLRGPKMGGSRECNLIDIKDNFKNFGGIENVYHYFNDYWKE